MAGNIKGIKIEIGGDTQPLQNALKKVNSASIEAAKELKSIDKALKFDTGNVTLGSKARSASKASLNYQGEIGNIETGTSTS